MGGRIKRPVARTRDRLVLVEARRLRRAKRLLVEVLARLPRPRTERGPRKRDNRASTLATRDGRLDPCPWRHRERASHPAGLVTAAWQPQQGAVHRRPSRRRPGPTRAWPTGRRWLDVRLARMVA